MSNWVTLEENKWELLKTPTFQECAAAKMLGWVIPYEIQVMHDPILHVKAYFGNPTHRIYTTIMNDDAEWIVEHLKLDRRMSLGFPSHVHMFSDDKHLLHEIGGEPSEPGSTD